MKILVIADPLASFKTYKDTTFAMLREAARRGHTLAACEPRDLAWRTGGRVSARATPIELTGEAHDWYRAGEPAVQALAGYDAVLMRKDPPFDSEYFYATHLLSRAQAEGARVVNDAQALREHPEKLAILEFPHLAPTTLVTRSEADVRAFHASERDIILKPLDGMGGAGIFRVREDGLNLGSVIETLNRHGAQTLMVQRFEPAIADGDKRVLVIAGEPVPFALARIPQGGEVRGNLAAGGRGEARPLTPRDRAIAEEVGAALAPRGLLLLGLDVIGERLTEINVTSPTGFQEITNQTGFDVAARFVDALETAGAAPAHAAPR